MFNQINHSCQNNIICIESECSLVTCLCKIENYHKNHRTILKSEFIQKVEQYMQKYPSIDEQLLNLTQIRDKLNKIIYLVESNQEGVGEKQDQYMNQITKTLDSLQQNQQTILEQNVCQQLTQYILIEQLFGINNEFNMNKNITENLLIQTFETEKQTEQEHTIQKELNFQQKSDQNENSKNSITMFQSFGYQEIPKKKICIKSKSKVQKQPNFQIKNAEFKQQFQTKLQNGPILEILQIPSSTDRVLILNQNYKLIFYNYLSNLIVKEFKEEVQTMRVNYGFLVIQDLDYNFIIYNIKQYCTQEAKIFCYTPYYQILPDEQIIYTKGNFLKLLNWSQKQTSTEVNLYESQSEIKFFIVYPQDKKIILIEEPKTIKVMRQQQSTQYTVQMYEQKCYKQIFDLKYQTQVECIIVYYDEFIIFNVQELTNKASILIGQFTFIQPILNTGQIFIVYSDQNDCSLSTIQLRNLDQKEIIFQIHNQGPKAVIMNDKSNTVIVGDDLGWITTYNLKKN